MAAPLEGRRVKQCSECGPRWVSAVAALVGAVVGTALFMAFAAIGSVQRGEPLIGTPSSEVTHAALMFPWWYLYLYLWLRWSSHYRHEPGPRTRYLLVRLGWSLPVMVGGAIVSKLIALQLIH
jgi:hypothetical protein